jgi:hypothetical protein
MSYVLTDSTVSEDAGIEPWTSTQNCYNLCIGDHVYDLTTQLDLLTLGERFLVRPRTINFW